MVNPEVEVSFSEKLARVPAAPGPGRSLVHQCFVKAPKARTGVPELSKEDVVCIRRRGRPDGPPCGIDV